MLAEPKLRVDDVVKNGVRLRSKLVDCFIYIDEARAPVNDTLIPYVARRTTPACDKSIVFEKRNQFPTTESNLAHRVLHGAGAINESLTRWRTAITLGRGKHPTKPLLRRRNQETTIDVPSLAAWHGAQRFFPR